jgi:hypothetical protein
MATSKLNLEELFNKVEEQSNTSNTSTKIFLLEKAIAELTGTVLVLKDELGKVKTELIQIKEKVSPSVLNNTIDTNITLNSNNNVQEQRTENITYMSTIKRIMDVKQYDYVGKSFQKYLLELVEAPGVYEIHRDMLLQPFGIGTKLLHQLDGNKIKNYRVQYS